MTRAQIDAINELVGAFSELGTLLSIVASTDVSPDASAVMQSAARLQEALCRQLEAVVTNVRPSELLEASHA